MPKVRENQGKRQLPMTVSSPVRSPQSKKQQRSSNQKPAVAKRSLFQTEGEAAAKNQETDNANTDIFTSLHVT